MTFGCMRWQQMKQALDMQKSFLQALEKMDGLLQFSSPSLPRLLMESAPDECHYFYRLGREMAASGALPISEVLERTGPCPLSAALQEKMEKLIHSLMCPGEEFRLSALKATLHAFEKATEEAGHAFETKGKLTLQLSLISGCALFLLLC